MGATEKIELIETHFQDLIRFSYGIAIRWDRANTVSIRLLPSFKGKTCGLCGNFNDNQNDDFLSPEGDLKIAPQIFGDSWNMQPGCAKTLPKPHPCVANPERSAWSHQQCNTINHGMFKRCHAAVDPKPYYDTCYYDTCGCDMGGD